APLPLRATVIETDRGLVVRDARVVVLEPEPNPPGLRPQNRRGQEGTSRHGRRLPGRAVDANEPGLRASRVQQDVLHGVVLLPSPGRGTVPQLLSDPSHNVRRGVD